MEVEMNNKQYPALKAVFLCDWFGGHYDLELIKHLNMREVEVETYKITTFFLINILKRKASILHIHDLHPFLLGRNLINQLIKAFLFVSQVYVLRLFGIKTIWTVHEWTHKSDGDITLLQSAIVGNCFHAIIAHCETTQRQIQKAFLLEKANKVIVIPHGNYLGIIENTISQQDAREKLSLPKDSTVFLIFGHLYPFKGHLEAIDAFQKLEQDSAYLLIIGSVGDIQFKEQIDQKIKGCHNIRLFPERIPDEGVQVYMNACDCVVLPYKVFTTSGIALMAMSFKRACIAPNKDFFSDTLGDSGGFLYDPTQENGLLQAMNFASKNKDQLIEMGQRNYNQSKEWDWNTIAEKTFQVYIK